MPCDAVANLGAPRALPIGGFNPCRYFGSTLPVVAVRDIPLLYVESIMIVCRCTDGVRANVVWVEGQLLVLP